MNIRRLTPLLSQIIICLILLGSQSAIAQKKIFESRNGYNLPVSGTIRILVILAEINYTSDFPKDPTGENGWNNWQPHHLPSWANNSDANQNAFDITDTLAEAQGLISKYFQQASFGKFRVIADYLKSPMNGGVFSINSSDGVVGPADALLAANNSLGTQIETINNLNDISFFDKWTSNTPGLPKLQSSDSLSEKPGKWDHVMIIWRNGLGKKTKADGTGFDYNLINGNGYCSGGSPGLLLGYQANTYSNFSIYGELNENIIRHEFSHLLYGGNNFHVAGGGNGEPNYWIPKISAYSNLSLYDATLACWNGWDRQRLNWKPDQNQFTISARDSGNSSERNGDLYALNPTEAGTYLLRDFITTGDAIRIRLPYIDSLNEYNEYIWIENHNGQSMNLSPFDRWFYDKSECVSSLAYGLHMYLQIDRDINSSESSNDVFGGFADYLRPITAEGFYDRQLDTIKIPEECLNNILVFPYRRPIDKENPLSGSGDNDYISVDMDKNHKLTAGDQYPNDIENDDGNYHHEFVQNGNNRQVFTFSGNNKIGIGTNPSTATMMSLVSYNSPVTGVKNLRKIYLTGISAEIIEQRTDGNIVIKIKFDDTEIDKDARWCAPEIVLNNLPTFSGYSLSLAEGRKLTLDLGTTPTKMSNPLVVNGDDIFSERTKLKFGHESSMLLRENSQFIVEGESTVSLDHYSKIEIQKGATLIIKNGSRLKLDSLSSLNLLDGGKVIVEAGGILDYFSGAKIFSEGNKSCLELNGILIIANDTKVPFNLKKRKQKNVRLGRKFQVIHLKL